MRALVEAHLEQETAEDRRFVNAVRLAVYGTRDEIARAFDRDDAVIIPGESDEDLLAASLAAWGYRLEPEPAA